MNLLDGLLPSRRAAWNESSNPAIWSGGIDPSRMTKSGEPMSPGVALSLSTYFDCIRIISEDVAKLPFNVYRQDGRNKSILTEHPVHRLLRVAPNPEMTAFSFRELLTQWALGWGGGPAEIVRDGANMPVALWPIHPSRVSLQRSPGGRIQWRVRCDIDPASGRTDVRADVILEAEQMFMLHGMGPNGLLGYSVAALAAETLGLTLAAQSFGAAYFANGSQSGALLIHPGKLTPTAQQNLRESWAKEYAGTKNAHKTRILQEGMKYERTTIPPNESQFIETRGFQVPEVCRWFRVMPHKVGHLEGATFSSVEQMNLNHVGDCLMPWMVRWEAEVNRSLLGGDGSVFAKHVDQALLRGDSAARATFYGKLFGMGALSANDICELEDRNGIGKAGDNYFLQTNLATVEDVAAGKHLNGRQQQTSDINPPGRPSEES